MRLRDARSVLLAAALLPVFVAGCHQGAQKSKATATHEYKVRGNIVAVDPSSAHVTLSHEAIQGFMEAMTMAYKLEDPSVASELHPGDRITATLAVDEDSAGPTNMRLRNIVVIAQAKPDYKPKVSYHTPTPGETVPDFRMLNQSNHEIGLNQFRGKVVLMTFIYTRCPLTDYCLRMSKNFAEMDKALQSDPKLFAETHLLSVSFDPKFDTPKVLRAYGGSYTGKGAKETFDHWDFAAPSETDLAKLEQFFSVGVTPGENGTLQHSLSTVVLDKEGKVLAYYPTNDWKVDEVLAKIRTAAA